MQNRRRSCLEILAPSITENYINTAQNLGSHQRIFPFKLVNIYDFGNPAPPDAVQLVFNPPLKQRPLHYDENCYCAIKLLKKKFQQSVQRQTNCLGALQRQIWQRRLSEYLRLLKIVVLVSMRQNN